MRSTNLLLLCCCCCCYQGNNSVRAQPRYRSVDMSTVLYRKDLSNIFGQCVLFMDYNTTANNTSVKFVEASCAWK